MSVNAYCLPRKFEDLAEECRCNSRYKKGRQLGKGSFGKVHVVVDQQRNRYAMKVQRFNKYAKAELKAYLELKGTQLLPKLYAAWSCKGYLYLVTEELFKCDNVDDKRYISGAKRLLGNLYKRGWLHGDVHHGNIMCTGSNRIRLVDFGLSVKRGQTSYGTHRGKTFGEIKKKQDKDFANMEEASYSYYSSGQ